MKKTNYITVEGITHNRMTNGFHCPFKIRSQSMNNHERNMFSVLICLCIFQLTSAATMTAAGTLTDDYLIERKKFLEEDEKDSVGGRVILDEREAKANQTLMHYKLKEMCDGFKNLEKFPPARSFLEARHDIEKSKVFKILKRFPKAAALHGHDTALASGEFVVKRLTYSSQLYAKLDNNHNLKELHFFQNAPGGEWKSVKEMREADVNKKEGKTFDDWLLSQLTLGVNDVGLNVNRVWERFAGIFSIITPMLTYEQAWRAYFYQTLQEFHDDNVSYLEFRGTLPDVYRLDGTVLSKIEICQLYVDTLNDFKQHNPDFFGARFIYAPLRLVDDEAFKKYMMEARELKKAFPDFIAGFDLVGQEDLGQTLMKFSKELLEMKQEMNFYFHAGETNWSGFSTDTNLVDALLLGTKRIGHGFAVTKHSKVGQIIKQRRVGIEVCPISNQVLGLVDDLRNHPATHFLTHDYPVVIASDDPGFWGAKGVSYDWYEAFIGMAAKWQDLRLLKQLALNSIQQSSLDQDQKAALLENWHKRWDTFVDEMNDANCVERNSFVYSVRAWGNIRFELSHADISYPLMVVFEILLHSSSDPKALISADYREKRDSFLTEEIGNSLGGGLILQIQELEANQSVKRCKIEELNEGIRYPEHFPPSRSFLLYKTDIEKTNMYKLLRALPKGASLTGHDTTLASIDFVVKKISYMDNLYITLGFENNLEKIRFFQNPPDSEWKDVKELRKMDRRKFDGHNFDDWLKSQLTFGNNDVGAKVTTLNSKLLHIFYLLTSLLTYEPVWCQYFYQILQEYHDDNVSYLEFRGTLPTVYRLDGTTLDEVQVCQLYVDTLSNFKRDNPTFYGAKFIYAPLGLINEEIFKINLRTVHKLKDAFPDFIAGFALVGREHLGPNLGKFSGYLLELQNRMNFYFHADETNWRFSNTDSILKDAVLLGAKRIGHGFALAKLPELAQIVIEQQIGVEICPISNQVLGLVQDLRNHPASQFLLRSDCPMVVSTYNPAIWGVTGTSYDWYEVFIGMAAKWQDLRLLKKLAMNSIQQTSLEEDQKAELFELWNKRWSVFINKILEDQI